VDRDQLEQYRSEAITQLFRLVAHLEIEVGQNMTIPLADIVEDEAYARVARILGRDAEVRSEQMGIKKALKDFSLRAKNWPRIEDELPV